jgi:DUF4097 and DUF4098 domain-containing protein YvlB
LQTSNGRITLALPADAEFRIDASTSNGKIKNGFDLDDKEKSNKNHLRGTVGKDPKVAIKLRTSNGSIEIREHEVE